jgi:peptide/nickel transport system permease protein
LQGGQAVLLPQKAQRALLAQFGLDKPLPAQFWDYLVHLVHGSFGTSVQYGAPARQVILTHLPWTLLLVGSSIVVSGLIGTLGGVVAAWKRGSSSDLGSLVAVMFLDSTPIFWLGMLLLGVFSVELHWLPLFGAVPFGHPSGLSFVGSVVERLALPAVTLVLGTLGGHFLLARYSMINSLKQDYLLTAEAAGLSQRRILFGHAMRNSMLPIVTGLLLNLGFLFGGATVVETVFSYPGLGRLMYDSVLARDYPVLQGTFLLLAVGVVLCNYLADLLYPLLDPRVRRPASVGT